MIQTKGSDILAPDAPDSKCSIHHWSSSSAVQDGTTTGGISGRAILLDYWSYAQSTPGKSYDPYTGHAIPFSDLQACATAQGINILPARDGGDVQVGDILLIRSGWVSRYHSLTDEQRLKAASRHVHIFASEATAAEEREGQVQEWAGIKQEQETLDWLHDCYFSAVAGDAPSFERWPSQQDWLLHEYVLALWGMPLGEMWDLEELAALCRREKRWSFFLSSAPDVVYGLYLSQDDCLLDDEVVC
jgi:Putative cyclase